MCQSREMEIEDGTLTVESRNKKVSATQLEENNKNDLYSSMETYSHFYVFIHLHRLNDYSNNENVTVFRL